MRLAKVVLAILKDSGVISEERFQAMLKRGKDYVPLFRISDENKKNLRDKLGYSFSWLRKLKSVADDTETEKILQDWLAELEEKKSAENG